MAYKFSLGTYRHSGSLVAEEGATVDSGGLTVSAGSSTVQALTASAVSASSNLQIGGTSTLAQTLTISGGGAVITGTVGTTAALTAGGAITATSGDVKADSGFLSASSGVKTAGGVQAAGNISGGTVTGSNGLYATGGGVIAQSGDIVAQAGQVSASVGLRTAGNIQSAQGYTAATGDIVAQAGYVTGTLGVLAGTAGGNAVVLSNAGQVSASAGGLFGGSLTVGNKLSVTGSATFNNTVSGSSSLTFSSVTTDNVDINGGAIDGATIGASSQSSVKATTLSGSSTLEVGSSATIGNGLTVTAGGLTVSAGDSSVQKLTVNGNLIVLGDTISASVGTLLIEDAAIVIGDGSSAFASDYGILFGSGSNQWASLVTAQDNIDGVAGNENILSSSLPIKASAFAGTLYGSMAATVSNIGNADATLVVGVNYGDTSLTAARTWTLPASPTVGQSVKVKAPSNCDATNYITIERAGSQTIDGETSIRLESPYAGVELVYVASNLWRVF